MVDLNEGFDLKTTSSHFFTQGSKVIDRSRPVPERAYDLEIMGSSVVVTKHGVKVEWPDTDQIASRHLTPITDFPDEPYEVITPIPVSYTYFAADDVMASFSEANISWSDEGSEKARQGLKIEILNAIDLYEGNKHKLDWGPRLQLEVLREYVRRKASE